MEDKIICQADGEDFYLTVDEILDVIHFKDFKVIDEDKDKIIRLVKQHVNNYEIKIVRIISDAGAD